MHATRHPVGPGHARRSTRSASPAGCAHAAAGNPATPTTWRYKSCAYSSEKPSKRTPRSTVESAVSASILHEAPFAKLFTDTVIVGQRHHAANDIDILGGADGWHGGIGNQKACDRSTHEHQLLTQSLTELRIDYLKQGNVGVVGVHAPNLSSSSATASVRSRALPPRTASKMASNSPSAGLRAAASGTLG